MVWPYNFQEAVNGGKVTEHGRWRVNYDDVFCSPWCCDSYYEDRYKILMNEMHELSFDSTIMVLLSVMCLFNCKGVKELTAQSTIASHGQKFSLLLHRCKSMNLLNSKDCDGAFL